MELILVFLFEKYFQSYSSFSHVWKEFSYNKEKPHKKNCKQKSSLKDMICKKFEKFF